MTNTPFNTLQFARQLTDAGMSHPLAEVLADQYSQFSRQNTEHLATKVDLKDLRADVKDLKADMKILQADLERSNEKTEARFQSLEEKIEARFQASEEKNEARFNNSDAKIQNLEERLEKKLVELQLRLIVFMGGGFVTLGSVMLTALKVMLRP